jgi:hypothetical protein
VFFFFSTPFEHCRLKWKTKASYKNSTSFKWAIQNKSDKTEKVTGAEHEAEFSSQKQTK